MKIQENFTDTNGKTKTRIIEVSNKNVNTFISFITSNKDDEWDKFTTKQEEKTITVQRTKNEETNTSVFTLNVKGKADIYWLPDTTK